MENKVFLVLLTSSDENWVGERREDDTTEEWCEGEMEHRSELD